MEEGLFHNPTFVQHMNEFAVSAVGHMEGHTEESRVNPATGATEKVCPHYDTIPCSAHQAVYRGAGNKFEFRGVPACFIADSSGKKLFEIHGQAPQQYIDKINEAQTQSGKRPITGSQIARWQADLVKGDAKIAEGKFKDARTSYQKVADDEKIPEFVRARARARVEGLAAKITAAIDAAKALEPVPAKRELKKLVKALKDFPDELKLAEEALAALGE
jgi:hypothetical protein